MGLLPSSIKLLIQYHKKYNFRGSVLSLGNQDIWASYADLKNYFAEMQCAFSTPEILASHTSYTFLSDAALAEIARDFVHAKVFFEMLGINSYNDMDKYDGDKPTHLHDLNLPVPDSFYNKFSMILDGGTSEHIFDIRQVLANITRMLTVGGCVVHICSYEIDHGFYGLSPCLFYDYYSANGFDDFTCNILQVDFQNIFNTFRHKNLYFDYEYGMNFSGLLDSSKQPLIFFVARKVKAVDELKIPIQGIYSKRARKEVEDNLISPSFDKEKTFKKESIFMLLRKKIRLGRVFGRLNSLLVRRKPHVKIRTI